MADKSVYTNAGAIQDRETVAVHAAVTREEVVREHDAKLALAIEKAADVAAAKAVAKVAADAKKAAAPKKKVVIRKKK